MTIVAAFRFPSAAIVMIFLMDNFVVCDLLSVLGRTSNLFDGFPEQSGEVSGA